jgi:hypothetical protein
VDELPEGRRDGVRRWLRSLIADFPDARYVITTRPAATPADWLGADDFTVAELEPMPRADVPVYVRRWHAAMPGPLSLVFCGSATLVGLAALAKLQLLNPAGTPDADLTQLPRILGGRRRRCPRADPRRHRVHLEPDLRERVGRTERVLLRHDGEQRTPAAPDWQVITSSLSRR